jgi:hypothetical protein
MYPLLLERLSHSFSATVHSLAMHHKGSLFAISIAWHISMMNVSVFSEYDRFKLFMICRINVSALLRHFNHDGQTNRSIKIVCRDFKTPGDGSGASIARGLG